jgi:Do/DeqQ family serine protease
MIFRFVAIAAILLLPGLLAAQTVVPQSKEQVKLSFAPVVKKAAPAVVNIYTRKLVQARAPSPLMNDPFFRHFFGDKFNLGAPQERIQRSLGSGVILGSDGLIVTNHHVIKDSDEITVILSDRREFEATLVGSDERTDLAVLRVKPGGESLPALEMGDSDAIEVGDVVLAIGNPFGVGQTVTTGIVSALARASVGVTDFQSFIQTDAAINPGNSGGALITLDGKLIGINTAIYSRDGGSIGIGFAIPTAMVKAVVGSITNGGKPVRPWLGAAGQSVTSEIAQSLGLKHPRGALIDAVTPGSPAQKAGLKQGDVVISVDGKEVFDADALRFRVAILQIGGTANLGILRNKTEIVLPVKLIAPPETPARQTTEIEGKSPFAGSVVANINPAMAEEMGINDGTSGIIIAKIKRGGVAMRVGLRPGDILLKLNGQAVPEVKDLLPQLKSDSRSWRITVKRDKRVLTISVGE